MIFKKNNLVVNEAEYLTNIIGANNIFRNDLELNNYILPNEKPIEIHPYLDKFPLRPTEKYIIGTFPPIQYLRDTLEIPNGIGDIKPRPKIPFFHGQGCDQWIFFLNDEELENIGAFDANNHIDVRQEQCEHIDRILEESDINYSDIIYSTNRKAYNANDESLENIVPNLTLIRHILTNNRSKYLNFNTSSLFNSGNDFGFYFNNYGHNMIGNLKYKVQSYELFLVTLKTLGFKLELKLNPNDDWVDLHMDNSLYFSNNYKNKALTKLRVTTKHSIEIENEEYNNLSKEFSIITGPSPSGNACRSLGRNQIHINWLENLDHNINEPLTHVFRNEFYTIFRENPDALVNWNIY
ncbi:hypothetical protein [Gelidibacter japonicus]|uniref:hypothetical protein n=1 Tax=Gelidibacter japonicus TaxID=1962232 RepID=UPI003A8DB0C8